MGVERGASKTDPYAPRGNYVPMTFISQTPQTVEQWRDLRLYSVIDGGKQSVMARILNLGHGNPLQANAKLPSELDGRLNSLERKNVAPNAIEFDAYAIQHPHEGMPFAVSGLDDKAYTTLMTWLDQGAKFDDVKIQPSALEQKTIAEWESFLNAPDDRSKLVARYIFEHYAGPQGFFYFDSGTQHFFALVRSTTPPGQEVVPIDPNKARRLSSPVEGPFYYRWMVVDQTPCVKQHDNLFDASGDRLERIKKIFYEQDWTVAKLPGYSLAEQDDPLNTFAAIPAKSRYKFLLQNARFHLTQVTASVSCRGTLTSDAIQDQVWVFFEDPDTSLYVNNAAYRASLARYTTVADGTSDDFMAALQNLLTFQKQRGQAIATAVGALQKSGDYRAQIADIWPNEMLTFMRYEDNVWTEKGAIGGIPKTAMIFDFPILERALYQGSIVPDIFAPIGVNLVVRNGFGTIRRDAELNFLRFLPPATRDALYASWYPLAPDDKLLVGRTGNPSDVPIPSEIAFKTNEPYRELLSLLLTRVGANANSIGRPASGDQPDPVTVAFRSIVAAGDQQPPLKFKNLLPSASFVRVDAPGRDPVIYTMKRDRDRYDLGDLNVTLKESDPRKDRVTIWRESWPPIQTSCSGWMKRTSGSFRRS